MLTTTRRAISYPNPDRSDRADISIHIGNVALAADVDVIFNQGTDAARLAAAHQTGGGRFWWTTDTTLLWYDDGATWRSVAPAANLIGLLGARPAANAVAAGTTFFASDQIVDYISDGTTWFRKSVPAGTTVDWFKPDAAIPTGWVLYDGGNLPAATGIYADLYAHFGNSLTKPDTRGRGTVGLGTNGDVSGMGVSDGLAVASRSPKHNSTNGVTATPALTLPNHVHSIADPGHSHRYWNWNGGNPGGTKTISGTANTDQSDLTGAPTISVPNELTGVSVGNPTSNPAIGGAVAIGGSIGPGGSRPTDSAAFIVCEKIGKL
jgi:hypothetical protein